MQELMQKQDIGPVNRKMTLYLAEQSKMVKGCLRFCGRVYIMAFT